ncbi:MAG: cysteine desulfurase [Thermoleophilia bacterium]|nr:cysteine desulfurase [Thermoleophilia bacterium]
MSGSAPIDATGLEAIRADLPAVRRITYLNAGTLGPLPQPTIDALARDFERDATIRQTADHWELLVAAQVLARAAVGSLTGVEPGQVALMHTTHEGINACLWGLDLRANDTIVTTDEEHPGLLVPLRHVRDRLGATTRIAPWGDTDEAFVEGILGAVDATTRVVALSHVSWQSGRIAPLRVLRAALPEGVRIIVDGAQSAGMLDVDPADGWDAYTVSGQKWPCGPNGSGGVAFADPEAWHPTFGAYMQLSDGQDAFSETSTVVATGSRFEHSQESIGPLVGLATSVAWLTDVVDKERARAHAAFLNQRARTRLVAGGVDPAALHGHHHLLTIDTLADATTLSAELLERGFLQRYLTPTRLRLSLGPWNTPAELDACVDAILERLADGQVSPAQS